MKQSFLDVPNSSVSITLTGGYQDTGIFGQMWTLRQREYMDQGASGWGDLWKKRMLYDKDLWEDGTGHSGSISRINMVASNILNILSSVFNF